MRKLLILIYIFAGILFLPRPTFALSYELISPSGTLSRDQSVPFTLNINTAGENITSATVGMTYDTQYLQYLSTTPGTAMTLITATETEPGKIVITGQNSSGFNGNGQFAVVSFKIIATAPGETELCALYAPSTTPTPVSNTPTTVNGFTPAPTVPLPTRMPVTGSSQARDNFLVIAGVAFSTSLLLFAGSRTLSRTKNL
ncbi:hypothetical protein HGB07_03150 [Candidatus Roizmanbacteria bacterium]|nr:hypothetical protein [Candidatus Roizmanbacteria bacterium]